MNRTLLTTTRLVAALAIGVPILGATALLPGVAHAQDDRAQKNERRVLKANDADLASRQASEFREKARAARMESIDRLKSLIKDFDGAADTKAEMLLRLADLYFEEGRELYLDEMERHQGTVDKCFNTPGCDMASIKADNTQSRVWQDKSIKLYKQILSNYPQFARADEAVFYLGQALNDTGQAEAASVEFTRLVKTYPESRWVPDSYVLIGEYWFDQNQAYKALSAYQRAAAYKEHEKYAFANYKLAWCFYNVGEYGKSIDTMKTVVSYSQALETQDPAKRRSNIQLQDEALKDLVRFFADAGEMDEAYRYFSQLGKKDLIRDMLKRLASTYFEQGKFEQAVQTYRRLIAEDPNGAAAPDFQNEIVQCYTKMGRKPDTIAEIERLLKTYGKDSAWARANASNQDAIKQSGEFIEKNLRTVALNYHNEAKKLRTGDQAKQTYALAEKAYAVYLDEFPESKYGYEVRYSYSELLYTIKKFDAAYDQYMKVVAIDPKGQRAQFCAESAIFAADEMVKREGKSSGSSPDPGKKTEAVPLGDWEKKLLAALDQYAKMFPTDEKVRNIIYRSAYLLYNKNHFKDASDRFRVVIGMQPKSKEAEQAANLILDSFALVEDWPNLKEVSKAFYDQEGLGGGDFKKEVYGIYENASLKLIEIAFKKTADKAKGASDYWAFYQEFPASANADLALNNASVYYHDLGRTSDEMKVRIELISKFPKTKYYKDQVAALAFNYESIADFGEAATWYEKLYSMDKAHPGSEDAIYSAALFRQGRGEWEQAIRNYQEFVKSYPNKPNINGINLEVAKIYEAHQKWPEASKIYLAYFTKPPANGTLDEIMFCRLQYGLMMDKIGQAAKIGQHWKDTLGTFEKAKAAGGAMETSKEVAGQIMFILAEPQYQAYMALKISGPGDKKLNQKQLDKLLKEQLVGKAKAMQEVEKTYTAILGTGAGEWGLAALVKLGKAYENLGESLVTSYVPAYLTEDQAELYHMALEDKAYPATEKAVTAYNEALGKSFELSVYDENSAEATRRLGVLRPAEFPGLFETLPKPRYSAPSEKSASFESEP